MITVREITEQPTSGIITGPPLTRIEMSADTGFPPLCVRLKDVEA